MRTAIAVALLALAADAAAGNRAYREGDFGRAVLAYQRALDRGDDSSVLRYNLGTALLRLGRYEEARQHLELAVRAGAPAVRQPAHYNAGNSYLEPAFRAPPSAARVEQLRQAIAAYRQALLLQPTDLEAKWNLELAQRLLDEQEPEGGGGGGSGAAGGEDQAPAQPDPSPAPLDPAGGEARLTPAQAQQILQAAEQIERDLQREKLHRAATPPPNIRDW